MTTDGAYFSITVSLVSVKEKQAEEEGPGNGVPRFCPYCGAPQSEIVVDLCDWKSHNVEDPANDAVLHEHQCQQCGGASFWT